MSKWKEASSLIISAACKTQVTKNSHILNLKDSGKYNFEILALKKNETLPSGNPQICVFPGGSISVADSVPDWGGLFSEFGFNLNTLSNTLINNNASRLPIFNKRREGIPRWLSLRITAIRETFEECGLLLCRSIAVKPPEAKDSPFTHTTSHLPVKDIDSWRDRVLQDPHQFFTLCESCKCYPDVENLLIWSNWLTPSHMNERYDAVFFFTHVSELNSANVCPDNKEISSTEWLPPSLLLELASKGEIFLKPPQWYEINSLQNIQTAGGLKQMAFHKSINCHLWMPVRIIAIDGEVSLLPGDDMYPDEVDPFFPSPIFKQEQTISSLRCKKMHRMEHAGTATKLVDTRSHF